MAIMKRLEAPGFWPIEKKTKKYTVAIEPGPHSARSAFTIAIAIRDVLKHAETLAEVREILASRTVKVNGTTRKEPGFPIGLMDVLTIGSENYRVLPARRGLRFQPIAEKEAQFTLKKILNKAVVKGGRVQLQLHDGSTMLVDGKFRTGDVVMLDSGTRAIRDTLKQEKGAHVIVIKGNNKGSVGMLDDIKIVSSPEPNIAQISAGDRKITLPLGYIFVIGRAESVISVGGENGE